MLKIATTIFCVLLLIHAIPTGAVKENGYEEPAPQRQTAAMCNTDVISESLVIVNCSNLAYDAEGSLMLPSIDVRASTLDLSHLKLYNLEILKDVDNFKYLVHLNLSNNMLTDMDKPSIQYLENIRHVDLSYNRLHKIPVCGCRTWSLNLDSNEITQLDIGKDIGVYTDLKTLKLSHNAIQKINGSCGADYLSKIESLDLSSNLIKHIEGCTFEKLTDLVYLNLSYNFLRQISESVFKTFGNLEKLDLSHNALGYIDLDLFKDLESLKYLDISHNQLQVLPTTLPMLDWFDASFNMITSLSEDYTTVLYPQAVFLLGGNPFVCNCDLLWLKEFFDIRKYLLNFLKNMNATKFIPVCDGPGELKGLSWIDLDDSVFQCEAIKEKDKSLVTDNVEQVLKGKDLVEASEIGKHFIILTWNIPTDLCKSIEIRYHKFGHKKDSKEIVLPSTVISYRLKNLDSGSPYVICVKITLTNDLQDCIEVITHSENVNQSITSQITTFCYQILNVCYSRFDVIVVSIGLFTLLYFVFLREKDE